MIDLKGWFEYYPVFEKIEGCFMPYAEEGNEWLDESELFCRHYLFYVFLFVAVKRGLIPYRGKSPILTLLTGKENYQSFCSGYDEDFLQLVIGIMKGCGFELPVFKYVRYPAYAEGRSTYSETMEELEAVLLAEINKLPPEVFLCWQEEARTCAEICFQAGYYMDCGMVVVVYTHRRYHQLLNFMKKNTADADDIEKLMTSFQSCQSWFFYGIEFTRIEVGGVTYVCEVMPVTINTDSFGDICCGFSPFFDEMIIYNAVKLALLIKKMEMKYRKRKKEHI